MSAGFDMLKLNRDCTCYPIAREDVTKAVLSLSDDEQMDELIAQRAHYFASTPVFIAQPNIDEMTRQIKAIEHAMKDGTYQAGVYDRSALAAFAPAKSTQGIFMGYDFHMTEDGPKLIEINSNAGGAFIVNAIRKAVGQPHGETENLIVNMFRREWDLAGQATELKTIAIIDEDPAEQYHYPDMLLAAALLKRRGIRTLIADPRELSYAKGGLYMGDVKIDFVYNRLTDFALSAPYLSELKQAWLDEAVVVSPDPRHHAMHADKRNLVPLSKTLPVIPETLMVTADNADTLWTNRKAYYFKPYAGFGSRAVYRGAKLTTSKWAEIAQGGYVAQKFVKPPLRLLHDGSEELKFDLRVYTYGGEPILMAARIYQGQVTNLRTAGGGLAPVIALNAPISDCQRPEDI